MWNRSKLGAARGIARLLPAIAFLGVLSLPLAQTLFAVVPEVGLGGKVTPIPPPVPITFASWHSGALQDRIEGVLSSELGMRDWMVRLDNQLRYSLLGVTKRPVLAGPGGWLFEEDYLIARGQLTADWARVIEERFYLLWLAQQVLEENGVTMITLLSPSKVETCPEHLPAAQLAVYEAGRPHCLPLMRAILGASGFHYVDAQALLTKWHREDPATPVFHRQGTHWTHTATARVVVEMIDYMERVSGVDLVNLDYVGAAPRLVPTDRDLLELSNLLEGPIAAEDVGEGVLRVRPGGGGTKQGVLIVATSFGWQVLANLRNADMCEPLTMNIYFRTAYDMIDGRMQNKRDVDVTPDALRKEILRHRFVIFECNAAKYLATLDFPEAVLAAFGMPKKSHPDGLTPERMAEIDGAITAPVPRSPVRR